MKLKLLTLSLFTLAALAACGDRAANNSAPASPKPAASVAPAATPVEDTTPMKDGDYDGKGVVTKVDLKIGSVEMDHEEIKDLMPAMRMEFYVSDKKMLDGLKVGDHVEFVVRYKGGAETVVRIKKGE
jgi:Cu/Ag efflux protein CusF